LALPDIADGTFNHEIRNSNWGGYNEEIIINPYRTYGHIHSQRLNHHDHTGKVSLFMKRVRVRFSMHDYTKHYKSIKTRRIV
jgi:hypothetical protein